MTNSLSPMGDWSAYCKPNWNSYIPCQHHTRTHFLSMTLSSFSTIIPHPLDLPSQPLSLLWLHTSLPFPSMHSMTPTFRRHGSCNKHMPQKRLSTLLLISCNSNHSLTPFHAPYGVILFRINSSTLKNFMHQWIEAIVTKMKLRTLLGAMCWSKRIITLQKSLLRSGSHHLYHIT